MNVADNETYQQPQMENDACSSIYSWFLKFAILKIYKDQFDEILEI